MGQKCTFFHINMSVLNVSTLLWQSCFQSIRSTIQHGKQWQNLFASSEKKNRFLQRIYVPNDSDRNHCKHLALTIILSSDASKNLPRTTITLSFMITHPSIIPLLFFSG